MKNESEQAKLSILHFRFNDILACIDVSHVIKVFPLVTLEEIPGSPSYIVGLMNLAGESIPVIDLAIRLGLSRKEAYSLETPILLCRDTNQSAGIIVDQINNLETIFEKDIQMTEQFDLPTSPFIGAILFKEEFSLLINVKRILNISLTHENNDLIFDERMYEHSQ